MNFLEIFDLLGTSSFAISGALVAMRKRLDAFGVFIIAFVTAVGGGTLRDIIVGDHPLVWMENMSYVYAIIVGTILAMLFRTRLRKVSKSLFLFDAIGLGLFTISGTKIGMAADFHPGISVALGTMSASFGGVLRDILCGEIPVIFRKEIYATIAVSAASIFLLLNYLNIDEITNYIATTALVIVLRVIVVIYKISFPSLYKEEVENNKL